MSCSYGSAVPVLGTMPSSIGQPPEGELLGTGFRRHRVWVAPTSEPQLIVLDVADTEQEAQTRLRELAADRYTELAGPVEPHDDVYLMADTGGAGQFHLFES
jgi:hypothetical protein